MTEKKKPSIMLQDTDAAPKNKGGRPSKYCPEVAQEMCELLSEGVPLREICRSDDKFPAWRTVYDWMWRDAELSTAIAHARDVGYDNLAEQCLSIADTPQYGLIETEDDEGKKTIRKEDMLGHRKLQIETRLKLLAKFNPKKYGDSVTHKGDDQSPLVMENNHNVFGELLKAIKLQRQTEA